MKTFEHVLVNDFGLHKKEKHLRTFESKNSWFNPFTVVIEKDGLSFPAFKKQLSIKTFPLYLIFSWVIINYNPYETSFPYLMITAYVVFTVQFVLLLVSIYTNYKKIEKINVAYAQFIKQHVREQTLNEVNQQSNVA